MHPILYNKFQGKARKIFKKFYQMCNVERISGVLGKLRFSRALRLSSNDAPLEKMLSRGELKKASPFFVRSDCRQSESPLEKMLSRGELKKASPFFVRSDCRAIPR